MNTPPNLSNDAVASAKPKPKSSTVPSMRFGSATKPRNFAPRDRPSGDSTLSPLGRFWSEIPTINRLSFSLGGLCAALLILELLGPPIYAAGQKAAYPYTEAGRRESCQNNLRSIAMAVSLYSGDNDGLLPVAGKARGSVAWANALPMSETGFQCPIGPSVDVVNGTGANSEVLNSEGTGSYGLNPVLLGGALGKVDAPGQTLLLADRRNAASSLVPPFATFAAPPGIVDSNLGFRHGEVASVVFADGHADVWSKNADLQSATPWGGSALFRSALARLESRDERSRQFVGQLRKGNVAGAGRLLRASPKYLKPLGGELTELWLQNRGESASDSLETLGWHLVRVSEITGDKKMRARFDGEMSQRSDEELDRSSAATRKPFTFVNGRSDQALKLPEYWSSEEKVDGRYRRLFVRSQLKDVYCLLEIGERTTYSSGAPIDWRGSERDLQRRYGAKGYKRLKMIATILDGQPANLWEYELEKSGSSRLRKRVIGYVYGYGTVARACTAPARDFAKWTQIFDGDTLSE